MKRLLACIALLVNLSGYATAQAPFPELTTDYALVSIFGGLSPAGAAKAAVSATKATASGSLLLESDNCGGQMKAVTTRFVIKQRGRNITAQIPSGRLLQGRGSRRGFSVIGGTTLESIPVFEELTVGSILKRKVNFRLSFSASFSGESCQAVYSGTLMVNPPRL